MYINNRLFNPMLMVLCISGGSLWSQTVQAADTIPVTITGVIQAPAESKTDTKNGVVIGKTRVIYDGNQKESTIAIQNQGKEQWVVQSTVDNDGIQSRNSGEPKPPFEVSPAVLRLGPDGNSSLHIRRASGNPPVDRESVYWLDIKTTPDEQHKQANTLTMSVNQRLKLFYRPAGIKTPADADYMKLTFCQDGENLRVSNPTPYYVTFYSLKAGAEEIQTNGRMVPPKSTISYKLASGSIIKGNLITWQVINDYAGNSKLFKRGLALK